MTTDNQGRYRGRVNTPTTCDSPMLTPVAAFLLEGGRMSKKVRRPDAEVLKALRSGREFVLRRRTDGLMAPESYHVVDVAWYTKRVLARNTRTGAEQYYQVDNESCLAENELPDDCNPWAGQ